MAYTQIQLRNDPSHLWTAANPLLEKGEMGVETDTFKAKFGDGITRWNALPYLRGTGTDEDGEPLTLDWGAIVGNIASNNALKTAFDGKQNTSEKGRENGYAPLDENIKIPAAYLPTIDTIPKGLIAMWSGTLDTMPTGWALCDGTDGRPNLLDRFVKGVANAQTNPGATGGAHSRSLAVANMPSHNHTFTGTAHAHNIGSHAHTIDNHQHYVNLNTTTDGNHSHMYNNSNHYISMSNYSFSTANISSGSGLKGVILGTNNASLTCASATVPHAGHSHGVSGYTNNAQPGCSSVVPTCSSTAAPGSIGNNGSGTAFDIQPLFYALAFIIKL